MKRKAKFTSGRQPDLIKGSPLNPNAAIASRYQKRLMRLIDRMISEAEREIKSLFKSDTGEEYFAQDESISSQARMLLNALQFKFDKLFSKQAKPIAEKMIEENMDSSEAALKASMKALVEGLSLNTGVMTAELGEVLTAALAENVGLIKSIPSKYFAEIQGSVYRSITTGNGLEDLVPALQKYKMISARRARLIASDQTRKSFSAINRIRAQKLGIKKFQWLHSHGRTHPRPLHVKYDHNIFDMDNPPIIDEKTGERGFPGQLINCFCKMAPVVDFGD